MKTKAMGKVLVALFAVSLVMMAAAWYVPSVPLLVLTVGSYLFLLGLLLALVRRVGLGRTALYAVGFYILWSIGIIPIPIPTITKDYPVRKDELVERSDVLKAKHPPYEPDMVQKKVFRPHSRECYVNKSSSVISIDLGGASNKEKELSKRIYPTFCKAIAAARGFEGDLLPSVDLVDQYKKDLDDRLLAALEEHLSTRSDIYPGGKQGLLKALLDEVLKGRRPHWEEAAAYLAAAIELGGGRAGVPRAVAREADAAIKAFLGKPAKSTPCGFYTESAALRSIFQRDRFLAQPFLARDGIGRFIPIADALAGRPELLRAYSRFRILQERITNAEVDLDMEQMLRHRSLFGNEAGLSEAVFDESDPVVARAVSNKGQREPGLAFWPAATSPESRLFAKLYDTPDLPETSCMEDLIVALRTGRANLDLQPDSGYYDYQLHALETLVVPQKAQEAQKLLLKARYKKRLREAFEAMLTRRRETHVKHLHYPGTCGVSIARTIWGPELSVEPCATNYLRTARAYRFLADSLTSQLTPTELTGIRLSGRGGHLLQELSDATALFYGLYLVVCNDIGMPPKLNEGELVDLPGIELADEPKPDPDCVVSGLSGLTADEQVARDVLWQRAKDWTKSIDRQHFLNEDVRVIAPVLTNMAGTQVRYWTVIGVKLIKIKASYSIPPRVADVPYESGISPAELLDYRDGLRLGWLEWRPKEYVIPVQVFAEVTLGPKPLTRPEFRAICDRCSTKEEVTKALKLASWKPGISVPQAWVVPAVIIPAAGTAVWLRRRRRSVRTK